MKEGYTDVDWELPKFSMYNILGLWKVDLMASLTVIFIESLLLRLVSERGSHVLFGSRIAIIFKTPATRFCRHSLKISKYHQVLSPRPKYVRHNIVRELFVSTFSLVISALKVIC